MGFEPFKVKPPTINPDKFPDATRQDKVNALAQKLYQRGLSSSMSDARRLAEGMVEVERKVVKQMTPTTPHNMLDRPGTAARPSHASSFTLDLPEEFANFVAHAASLTHDTPRTPRSSMEHVAPKTVVYGRGDEPQRVAEVPHTMRSSQVFYDDAPDLTKLRGYIGPKPTPVEYASQQLEGVKRPTTPLPSSTESLASEVTRVTTGDAGVKVTRVETTQDTTVVEEKMVIIDEKPPMVVLAPFHEETPRPKPTSSELLAEVGKEDSASLDNALPDNALSGDVPEDLPEKTVLLPQSDKPRVQEDLAKKHGVDLFEMFKKKG